MGIIITLILCIPANAVIKNVTDISNVAQLPVAGAVILVIISMLLTTIARDLFRLKMAAKKDPVCIKNRIIWIYRLFTFKLYCVKILNGYLKRLCLKSQRNGVGV